MSRQIFFGYDLNEDGGMIPHESIAEIRRKDRERKKKKMKEKVSI